MKKNSIYLHNTAIFEKQPGYSRTEVYVSDSYMLLFNFILGLNFNFFCFENIIIHYRTEKEKETKFKPRIKLNHNNYM